MHEMQIILNTVLGVLLVLLPVGIVLAVMIRKRKEQRAASRAPFDGLTRRPAGEALRIKLEELDDKLSDLAFGLVILPVLLTVGLIFLHPASIIGALVFFVYSTVSSVYYGRKSYKAICLRAKYRLGYEGERFVGEAISRLIYHAFEIYHDVPFETFNLDHVMVGPRGVFVVETKTRSMPVKENGKKEYRVQFDGKCLKWPNWKTDNESIEQAKRNAATLSVYLSPAIGKKIWVTPIVTAPGWTVELLVPCDNIYVLNTGQIYDFCSSQPERLTGEQIANICHQLDQKCRLPLK